MATAIKSISVDRVTVYSTVGSPRSCGDGHLLLVTSGLVLTEDTGALATGFRGRPIHPVEHQGDCERQQVQRHSGDVGQVRKIRQPLIDVVDIHPSVPPSIMTGP